jgi:hypothetical protein
MNDEIAPNLAGERLATIWSPAGFWSWWWLGIGD